MAQVTLERDGLKVHAELTLSEIKELMGVKTSSNGNGHNPSTKSAPSPSENPPQSQTGYRQFLNAISDRGREFIRALTENPDGIEANVLAVRLGFTNPTQIGGLTGGGLAKIAKRTHVDIEAIYRTAITTPNGIRTVMFYPGKLLLNEKPA